MRGGYFSNFELDSAPRDGVIRLAKFMGIAPGRKPDETDGQYWHRCKHAILREDKRLANLPRAPKGAWTI